MRNVILLHARADADLAEELVSKNRRVALICAIDRATPPGRFGPQFHIAALWTPRAAALGLETVMAESLAGRERESLVIVSQGLTAPPVLASAGLRVMLTAMTDLESVFATAAPRASAEDMDFAVSEAARTVGRRRTVAAATTAALSIGCGALLAHAASPFGLIPSTAEPAFTPMARVAHAPALEAAELSATLPAIEAVVMRADAIRASAAAVAEAPAIRARFERVKSLAVSDMLLAQMSAKASQQAETLFSAAPRAAQLAAADVAPPAWAGEAAGAQLAQADLAPELGSTF
jgi:hypothetical protein